MAELSLRRFQWFAHVTKQRRVRSAEIMPADPWQFCFCACRKQAAFVQISRSLMSSVVTGEDEGII